MIAAKVQETTNYKLFELHDVNRDIERIQPLIESMKKYGWVNSKPMTVVSNGNGKLKITDGHHRFEVAQRLGIAVKYVVVADKISIYEMNKPGRAWSMNDYLTSYARSGKIEYVKVKEFCKKTGINVAQAISMLAGNQAGANNFREAFKEGRYSCKNRINAETTADIVLYCKKLGIKWAHHSLLVAAISKMTFLPEFSPVRLKTKIKAFPYLVEKRPHLEGYMDMIENVYNFKSQDKIPLKFLANKAAKERSIIFALK